MQVSLVMFKADGTRRDFPLQRERVIIGRKNNCDLRIPLSSVSRQHCELRVTDDTVTVRDLGSSNGTYHNSIRVQEAVLSPGDEVIVGPVVFTVVIDGEPANIEPVKSMMAASESGHATHVEARPATGGAVEANQNPDEPAGLPQVEPENHTPTVDLDDPIAALERLAEAERTGDGGSAPTADPSDESGDLDFDFDLDDENEK